MSRYKDCRYIDESEVDGEVNSEFLKVVDRFISCVGAVVKILNFTKGKHSKDSAHYQGLAADVKKGKLDPMRIPSDSDIAFMTDRFRELILKPDKDLFEQAIIARFSGAEGVGMYPWGLHLDKKEKNRPHAWYGIDVKTCEEILNEAIKNEQENVYFGLV